MTSVKTLSIYVVNHAFPIHTFVPSLDICHERAQVHVALEPKQAVEVERAMLVCLYSPEILADASEYGLLSDSHVMLEEYGDLPVKEDGRTERVRYREPDPLVCLVEPC